MFVVFISQNLLLSFYYLPWHICMCVNMHMCMQVPMETDEDGGVSGPGAADRSYLI